MAVGDVVRSLGTPIVWTSSGGDYALDFSSVIDGNGRSGAKGDLGSPRVLEYEVKIEIKAGTTAPTAGSTYDVYWCESNSATAATGNAGPDGVFTGSDALLTAPDSNELSGLRRIGSIVCTNTSAETFIEYFPLSPGQQYGFPVIVNNSAQTVDASGTNHSVSLYPVTINSVQS